MLHGSIMIYKNYVGLPITHLISLIMKKIHFLFVLIGFVVVSCSNNEKKGNTVTTQTDNPLIQSFNTPFQVPPFDKIKPEHFVPAYDEAMKKTTEEIDAIVNNTEKPTFSNTIGKFLSSGELLMTVTNIFQNTVSSNSTPDIQKISEEMSPKLSAFKDGITLNPKLFEKIKTVYDDKNNLKITPEQGYLLENAYLNFVRNGALLTKEKQEELKKINQELASLTVKFEQNLLAETNAFKLIIDKKEDLAGLTEGMIAAAAETAQKDSMPGKWIFKTNKPSMIPFLQYAKNRELREKLYFAYTNRGNNNNANDNKKVLASIVSMRAQKARLLGYANYAAYKLESRMAKTPERTFALLNQLWEKSIKVAKKEASELQQIINKEGGNFKLASWDWWYYSEKLRGQKYSLDENELRPYLKMENVRDGIFTVANKLYGLTFTPIKNIPTPDPDSQAYEVKEADGKHLGIFYLDFFPRESKQGGAWCTEYRGHHYIDSKEVSPVTTVVCNFTKPTKDAPSLLSMDEVETLFHECGHAFESLMSKVSYITTYTAQDFVELPSQLMEHWAFDKEVLKLYAKHYKTNETMPDALADKISKSSLFNQGFATTEYLAASLLDLAYHDISDAKDLDVLKFEKDFFNKIGLIPEIVSRYRSTYFAHIMGGYDAGYYGYIWAGVLDNDAFDAFREAGIFDSKTAILFRKNILEKDGEADPDKMYINFRGREAKIEPLLKNRGLL